MLILYDTNKRLCVEWEIKFEKYIKSKEVLVVNREFKDVVCDNIVTAGNSYGWMTGGIDLAVREYYGQWIQDEIQRRILQLPGRYLPVGDFIEIFTRDKTKENLIYLPTMDVPKFIEPIDVVHVLARLLMYSWKEIACCGLGTGCGGLSESDCAQAMLDAYEYTIKSKNRMRGLE